MVVRAYTVCIGVTLECRRMESEMIGDGRGHVDKADKAYHDSSSFIRSRLRAALIGLILCGHLRRWVFRWGGGLGCGRECVELVSIF